MRIWIDIVAGVLFVIATGLLYSETVRARRLLFTLVGVLALAASYVLVKQILDATVGHRMHHRPAVASAPVPDVAAAPAKADVFASDAVLELVYSGTEAALNKIVRAGTKQSSASVSSDTVVDVIVGMSLAVLGLLSQLLSGLVRRLTGAEG